MVELFCDVGQHLVVPVHGGVVRRPSELGCRSGHFGGHYGHYSPKVDHVADWSWGMRLLLIAIAVCVVQSIAHGAEPPANTLIQFHATWCGPCQNMKPIVTRLEKAGCPVTRVDVDKDGALKNKYGVGPIPCFVAVVDGKEKGRIVGATSYAKLRQLVISTGVVEPVKKEK